MPNYIFSVRNSDGSLKEELGAMALNSDESAFTYAKLIVADLMREDTGEYAGWILDIAEGKRVVGALSCDNPNSPARFM